jgi:hypothetical protein
MEYVSIENDFQVALGAQPEDFAEAMLRAYQNAIRIAAAKLPVIQW